MNKLTLLLMVIMLCGCDTPTSVGLEVRNELREIKGILTILATQNKGK